MAGLIKSFGIDKIMKFFPPLLTGPMIIAIGLVLSGSAIQNCTTNWLLAIVAVATVIGCFAVASASVEEIDRMNILEADFLAMRRALQALGMPGIKETAPEIPIFQKGMLPASSKILIAVDGNLKIHGIPEEMQIPVVKGDGRIASISAASILAKVFRDRYMDDLEKRYPGYGFDKHAGYGTKAHLEAIRHQGMTPEHRKSFHPKSLQTELDL